MSLKAISEFGEESYDLLAKKTTPSLSFSEKRDFEEWKSELKGKFRELLGLDSIEENEAQDSNFTIEFTEKKEGYTLTRFSFSSEEGTIVPCYLLIPDTNKEKYPVAITLQGHSTGFHNSIGVVKFENDAKNQPRVSFALQAVENGFATLCIEQRGMGERKPTSALRKGFCCDYTSMRAIILGRTILGERIFDIKKALDVLCANFAVCDTENVVITGNSGGGTASYYAACYDERIKICAPSCGVCSYYPSIIDKFHCSCNYIPSAYKHFDMGDLSALIAPRTLCIIAGKDDEIFPIDGVRDMFSRASDVYKAAGSSENCSLTETPMHHWWCPDIIWPTITKKAEELGMK